MGSALCVLLGMDGNPKECALGRWYPFHFVHPAFGSKIITIQLHLFLLRKSASPPSGENSLVPPCPFRQVARRLGRENNRAGNAGNLARSATPSLVALHFRSREERGRALKEESGREEVLSAFHLPAFHLTAPP